MFSKLKVVPLSSTCHEVYIEGVKQEHVSHVYVDFSPSQLPEAVVTYYAMPEIDEVAKIRGIFDTDSIREAIKFLSLQLQFNEDLRDAWIYSIESALIESREKDIADTYEIAKTVLERIIE